MQARKRDKGRGKLCEVSHISHTRPAGCETSQLSDLACLRGILSFFLSCFYPSSSVLSFGILFCENAEMSHECVWQNEKHMGSLEELTDSLLNANVSFRV